jgi:glycosyltransferase involved in cell wall biosynthesis
VEAMSMGCIPVVYRDGGPWTDILGETEGVYGYAYENAVEAAERIEEILGDGELRASLRENSIQRSKEFDSEKFGSRILKIIETTQHSNDEDWLTKVYKGIRKIGEIKALSLRR